MLLRSIFFSFLAFGLFLVLVLVLGFVFVFVLYLSIGFVALLFFEHSFVSWYYTYTTVSIAIMIVWRRNAKIIVYTRYTCASASRCAFSYMSVYFVYFNVPNFSYARDGNMLMQKRYGKWCAGYWQVCASFQMTLKSLYLAFALALSLPLSLCLYDLSYGVGAHLCGSCVMPVVINILYYHRQCHCHCHFGCGVRVFVVWLKSTHNNFCLWKFYVRARAFNEYSDERDGRRMRVNEFLSSVFFFLFVFQLYAKHDASAPRFSIDTLKFKRSISRLKEFYSYV